MSLLGVLALRMMPLVLEVVMVEWVTTWPS